MDKVLSWLEKTTGISGHWWENILFSILSIALIWLVQRVLMRVVNRQVTKPTAQYHWRKGVNFVSWTVCALIIGRIWVEAFDSLFTFIGLVSAGLVIALRDPLVNIAGWFYIQLNKPFDVGHRISLGGVTGDVVDIRLFQFSLIEVGHWVAADQSTGRTLHIPNSKVFSDVLANYTTGFNFIWHEIPVLVTFESDWKKAKTILQQIITERTEDTAKEAARVIEAMSREKYFPAQHTDPIVFTNVEESGVLLTLRFMCIPDTRRKVEEDIWEAILEQFAKDENLNFAYPTRRLINKE